MNKLHAMPVGSTLKVGVRLQLKSEEMWNGSLLNGARRAIALGGVVKFHSFHPDNTATCLTDTGGRIRVALNNIVGPAIAPGTLIEVCTDDGLGVPSHRRIFLGYNMRSDVPMVMTMNKDNTARFLEDKSHYPQGAWANAIQWHHVADEQYIRLAPAAKRHVIVQEDGTTESLTGISPARLEAIYREANPAR